MFLQINNSIGKQCRYENKHQSDFRGNTTNVNQQGAVANTCHVLSDNIYRNINSLRGVKKMK